MGIVGNVVVGLVIFVGLVGVVVPLLPGLVIVAAAILVWAIVTGGAAWIVCAVALVLIAAAWGGKYALAGKSLRGNEIPWWSIGIGAIVGIVGFFVVPVVGLPLGFLAGTAAAEAARRGDLHAGWRAAVAALRALGIAMVCELLGGLGAATAWGVGAIVL